MKNNEVKKELIIATLFLLLIISFSFMPKLMHNRTFADSRIAKAAEAEGYEHIESYEVVEYGYENACLSEQIEKTEQPDGRNVCKKRGICGNVDSFDSVATANYEVSKIAKNAEFLAVDDLKKENASDAAAIKYNAKSALLMDFETGEILQRQNSDERRPIASMVKIMTLNLIFDEIEKGNLDLGQQISVSENAAGMGGSQAFLQSSASYQAGELIKSIVVASANDSCVAMAEHIAGSVESFVERMNENATALGLINTYFANCTGLPAPNQYSTAADVAVMFRELIKHEQFFEYSKIWMYDFVHPGGRVTQLTNTNKLVRFYNGCDGGKTGFTNEALSCLAATAKRGDTRLISVVIAAPSSKERNAEVSKMLNYGFANYETRQIVFKGIAIDEKATVEKGKENSVTIAPANDYFHLIKKGEKPNIEITSEVNKIKAPVKQGDVAGKINVMINGEKVGEVNLTTMSDIGKASYLDFVDKLIEAW